MTHLSSRPWRIRWVDRGRVNAVWSRSAHAVVTDLRRIERRGIRGVIEIWLGDELVIRQRLKRRVESGETRGSRSP